MSWWRRQNLAMSTSRRNKGQTSLEFITMLALALIVFASFYAFFVQRQAATLSLERHQLAESVADQIRFELDLALTQGHGFSRTFDLRNTIGGDTYTVTVASGTIILEYGDRSVVSTTAAYNVSGTVQPGTNTVRNSNGILNITQP